MVKEVHKIIKNHPSPPSQNKSKRLLVLHSKERPHLVENQIQKSFKEQFK